MIAKSVVVAVALFSSSIALAASSAIGTVSTRGEIRVGGYAVRGTATLFDNTAVETSDFAATLRLDRGTEIKLAGGSSGTLFRDRLILSRGETELTTSTPFQLDASGLQVSPSAPNTSGIVSVSQENTVEVATLKGELRVTDSHGILLAHVGPGSPVSFSADPSAAGAPAAAFSDIGIVSVDKSGQYFLTSSLTGVKYQISGKDLSKYVGNKVTINGTLISGTPDKPISVAVSSIGINGGTGISTLGKVLIGTSLAGAGVGIGYAVGSASP